jgi:hypothetical protein
VYWNVAGAVGIADVLTILFLIAFAFEWGAPRFPRTTAIVLAFFALLLVIYLVGFFNIETKQTLDQWGKGDGEVRPALPFPRRRRRLPARRPLGFYWRSLTAFTLGLVANSALRRPASCLAAHAGRTSTTRAGAADGRSQLESTSTARSAARPSTDRTRLTATRTTSP